MLNHKGTQNIQTARLILRRAVPTDGEPMFRNWASDPIVVQYLTWPLHQTPEVSQWVVDSWVEAYEDPTFYQWMIQLKALGEPIGSISVVRQDEREVEIGYCIGAQWWHQGIASEALAAVMDYLFREVGVERICARHDPNNPHSGGVMRKCGLEYEGTTIATDKNNQGICDCAHYAVTQSVWRSKNER